MVLFAYDGSLNGDWVAHYALGFAAHSPERRLHLVHVREPDSGSDIAGRVQRIATEAEVLGVALESEIVECGAESVVERLLAAVSRGSYGMLVCGTRARPRNLAYLAGTVSARLLRDAKTPVAAIRVAQPGLLGQPRRLLLPLAGHPRGVAHVLPLLRSFGSSIEHLHVLVVRELGHARFRLLGAAGAARELARGREFAARVERELSDALGAGLNLDTSVVVSDDAPREILVHAGKVRTGLICLGASERTLPERLVYGNPIEQVLRDAPSDVAVYRGPP
jgi:nucleotide-binding universal stress UspA family protein